MLGNFSVPVGEAIAAISDATADGTLTVSDSTPLKPGALAWVSKNDGSASARVRILKQVSSTQLVVRQFKNNDENGPPSYGRSDMSAFATGSSISMEAQTVPVSAANVPRESP